MKPLKLSEHLLYRDIKELGQMANFYECDCNRNSKLELVQSIHFQLLNRKVCQQEIEKIDASLLLFITYLYLQKETSFHVDEMVAKGNYICKLLQIEEQTRSWLAQLLKMGWLFPVSHQYQTEIHIPIDLKSILEPVLLHYWNKQLLGVEGDSSTLTYRDEHLIIMKDLAILLQYLQKEAVPLTTEGYIYKRNQQQLMQQFRIQEELVTDHTWRFGYGRRFPGYPSRLALIYDFAFSKGWITEENTSLTITSQGLQVLETIKEDTELIYKELISYWLKIYKLPIPLLPFIIPFMYKIMQGEWIEMGSIKKIMQKWLLPYYYDDTSSIFQQRIIQMLLHLGLAQIAVDNQKGDKIFVKLLKCP